MEAELDKAEDHGQHLFEFFDVAHLVAESLDISLSQLLAVHQTLDPAVERGDGGRLVGDG